MDIPKLRPFSAVLQHGRKKMTPKHITIRSNDTTDTAEIFDKMKMIKDPVNGLNFLNKSL